MTTAVPADAIGRYVITQLQPGAVLPIEAFRELAIGGGGSEPSEQAPAPPDRAFGSHIREAIDVLRRHR